MSTDPITDQGLTVDQAFEKMIEALNELEGSDQEVFPQVSIITNMMAVAFLRTIANRLEKSIEKQDEIIKTLHNIRGDM